jgi:hypothetical protein
MHQTLTQIPPSSRRRRALTLAVAILSSLPLAQALCLATAPAMAQQAQPPVQGATTVPSRPGRTVEVYPSDLARRYVEDNRTALNLDGYRLTPSQDRGAALVSPQRLETDIAYNVKVWHLVKGAQINCSGSVFGVTAVRIEAVHFYDGNSRATVFYTAATEAADGTDPELQRACAEARAELLLIRLINGELYAPEWGRRLVMP